MCVYVCVCVCDCAWITRCGLLEWGGFVTSKYNYRPISAHAAGRPTNLACPVISAHTYRNSYDRIMNGQLGSHG